MTAAAAAKHKEVIKWFCEYPEKGVWIKDYNTQDWLLSKNPEFSIDLTYVQNDDYTEFRKALVDGKVLQWFNENLNIWVDYKEEDAKFFLMCKDKYRIKPDELEYKIGDWVVIPESTQPSYITQFSDKIKEIYSDLLNDIKLWTPRKDEWCVFWNDKHMHYTLGQYSHIQHGNDFIKQGDLSYYNNIAPLEFVRTLREREY